METLGALFILLGFGLALGGFACLIWALVHAARSSDEQFRVAGQSRVLWLVLIIGGLFVQPVGLLLAVVYVAAVRPRVNRAAPTFL